MHSRLTMHKANIICHTLTIIKKKGYKVDAYVLENANEMMGVNDQEQLKEVEQIVRQR